MKLRYPGLALLVATFLPVMAANARAAEVEGPIEKMMSADEFKASGLQKLSPEELEKLNAWLQGYRNTTVQKAADKAATKAAKVAERTKLDLIVSRVIGNFPGLSGGTVVALEDGTSWKQANSDDMVRASPKKNPGAVVIKTAFGYKMRIEGSKEFYVDPVRAK